LRFVANHRDLQRHKCEGKDQLAWTYEEIEHDWLAGNRIAASPTEIIAAFNRCDRMLGRSWLERAKVGAPGTHPTLRVIELGKQLGAIEDVSNTDKLIEKILKDDPSAFAEVCAIHLLRSVGHTEVDLEPIVQNEERTRYCDFRIRRPSEPWVYVEVTRPDTSESEARARQVLASLAAVVAIQKPFTIELFLRKEPSDHGVLLYGGCSGPTLSARASLWPWPTDSDTLPCRPN